MCATRRAQCVRVFSLAPIVRQLVGFSIFHQHNISLHRNVVWRNSQAQLNKFQTFHSFRISQYKLPVNFMLFHHICPTRGDSDRFPEHRRIYGITRKQRMRLMKSAHASGRTSHRTLHPTAFACNDVIYDSSVSHVCFQVCERQPASANGFSATKLTRTSKHMYTYTHTHIHSER